MQRSLSEGTSKDAVVKFEKLIGNIAEDLDVVRDRVPSANVMRGAREGREQAEATGRPAGPEDPEAGRGGLTEIPDDIRGRQLGR